MLKKRINGFEIGALVVVHLKRVRILISTQKKTKTKDDQGFQDIKRLFGYSYMIEVKIL